jgi:hypothetical protein
MARWSAAAVLLGVLVFGLLHSLPSGELKDYGSFVASGGAALEGENPYGIHPLTFHVVLPGIDLWNPNLNPPVSLPAFAILSLIEPAHGFEIWWSVSVGCYVAAVLLLVRGKREAWLAALWAFALAGFWDTLSLGQIYLPLVFVAASAWVAMEQRHLCRAGVLLGIIVAVKPNFAVWPLLLLIAGHRRVALWAIGSAAVLSLLPALWLGAGPYWQWLELIASDRGRAAFLTNASLPGLAARAGLPFIGIPLGALSLLMLMYLSATRRPTLARASALGILGGIVASPLAWVHYTLFLLPVFCRVTWSRPLTVAALLLVIPVQTVLRFLDAPVWQQITIGSIYTWAVLLCGAHLAIEELRRPSRVAAPAAVDVPLLTERRAQ